MRKLFSVLSLVTCGIVAAACSSAPDGEVTERVQQAAETNIFTWSSSNPGTSDLVPFGYPGDLCVATGWTGQMGGTFPTVGGFVFEDYNGYWDIGGSPTPSGYAPLSMQVYCTWPGSFHGAGFDHIFIGTPQTLSYTWSINGTRLATLTPTSPGSSVGNTFYPLTSIDGDFSSIGSSISTMQQASGADEWILRAANDRSTSLLAQSFGFQLQDVNNNPITPHTVQQFNVNAGHNTPLPNTNVAFCFVDGVAGPLNSATTSGMIVYNEGLQSVVTSSPGPDINVICIDYDLAN